MRFDLACFPVEERSGDTAVEPIIVECAQLVRQPLDFSGLDKKIREIRGM